MIATNQDLKDLIGATIMQAETVSSYGEDWPVLVAVRPDGKIIQIEISRDSEGNGPGCLFVSEVE